MNTMLLAVDTWDLVLDANRNIALAQPPYALAQDVASAIRTFLAEVYYDTTLGVPYFTQILGKTPPVALFQEYMIQAALTVPGVAAAQCFISAFDGRTISGQVQIVADDGTTAVTSF